MRYILFLFVAVYCTAQTFNYERTWGTYFGGTNTRPVHLYENNLQQVLLDGVSGVEYLSPAPTSTYYNQFITNGAQGFISSSNTTSNDFTIIFSSTASLQKFEYRTEKKIIHREKNGNYFTIANTGTPTTGVWLNTPVEPANNIGVSNRLLEKYDGNNNLIWRTYVPSLEYEGNSYYKSVLTDSSGNIYIFGLTLWQSLGDPGTAFPNFTPNTTPGVILPNVFVAKLNPQGQKIWATYLPASYDVHTSLYNNDLYVASLSDINAADNQLSTPGSFQSIKAETSITKLNATNGARLWGTYYGNSSVQNSGIQSMVAQADGVYILGVIYNTMGNSNGYFASTGAFQSQSPGGEYDLYIAKFDVDDGDRTWGTYYGTPNNDARTGSAFTNMDVKNNKILIAHVQNGNINFTTQGAYKTTKPTTSAYDIVFSMFDPNGGENNASRIFTSYYGGSPLNVNFANVGVSCKFAENEDAFYLFGYTNNPTEYTEPNAIQSSIIYPSSTPNNGYAGFLAKFSLKTLGVSNEILSKDLQLFNNPNNGNFALQGDILAKENCSVSIFDASGRILMQKQLGKTKKQDFQMQNILSSGNYLVEVKGEKQHPFKTFKMIVNK